MGYEVKVFVEDYCETITTTQQSYVFQDKEKALLSELENHKNASSQAKKCGQVKIQKVPNNMKLRNSRLIERYVTPSEISIGPIHANNNQLAKRDLKLQLAAKFLVDTKASAENLLGCVKNKFVEIKECFEDSVIAPFDEHELLTLLFLDACFVLQFIISTVCNELNKFGISNGLHNSIQQDLFLLENQLPFQLLEILINSSPRGPSKTRDPMHCIIAFVAMNLISPPDYYFERSNHLHFEEENPKFEHLLQMLRSELLFTLNGHDCGTPKISPTTHQRFYRKSFRNVQDLKEAGISLKPSDSSTFLAVSFSTGWFFSGELRLPAIIVDNSTASKLWNLVAYEMCPDNCDCDFGVSSYLSLMDSLVDNVQDVRDLRADHVLLNRLSSDEDVAILFNEIGSNLVTNETYEKVKQGIQMHYESKWAVWVNQVWLDYFSSPWKVMALIMATIAILLTAFSTWFTVYPPIDKR